MTLPKRYNPRTSEPQLQDQWQQAGTYHFDLRSDAKVYSIDTPPATVSGKLHMGHTFSYSHPDFIARFWRMKGYNVYYPMGYDDNGLPTERLVERQLGASAPAIGRSTFIEKCLQISAEAEKEYQQLWQRMGLSIDWRYTYRTIDADSRHIAQLSFLELYRQGLIYHKEAPTIWCPECHTAIAQAELNDIDQQSEFVTLIFKLEDGTKLQIATTRPELLPACVAIFVHPEDDRYQELIGKNAKVPIFEQTVPIFADEQADPNKGTGIVMCCTFGDQTDVAWWYTHQLPLVEAIDENGCLTNAAGPFAGLPIKEARHQIKQKLHESQLLIDREPITHSVRVHERCDTPAEYIITRQWFVNVLDAKDEFLAAGERVNWHPVHMKARYRAWVENLTWDWCISRQRYYGIPFPVWYCSSCGETILADEEQLPIEPLDKQPTVPCANCGDTNFEPDPDVMDTWATSSLTPQIAGKWLQDPEFYEKVFPFSLRPQAHDIIRTWAFYTIVKSRFHFSKIPWSAALISGWGIAGEGMGKISKSRGGGPMPPIAMIEKYAADAVRYWAASTGPGKDAVISEEKIQIGAKLVNKIWNVARFSARFIPSTPDPLSQWEKGERSRGIGEALTPADRWQLSRTQRLIQRVTALFEDYDYAAAKAETEAFFWHFADNYLELAKQRLYDDDHPQRAGAVYALQHTLLTLLKLFAPILPHVTERIYQGIFATGENESIHTSAWPVPDESMIDNGAEALGETILKIATTVRRFKSERNLSLGTELKRLQLAIEDLSLRESLTRANADLMSITRAVEIEIIMPANLPSESFFVANGINIIVEI
jgi:valyl-tRNA synthetase